MTRTLTEDQKKLNRERQARYRERNRAKINAIQREKRNTPEYREKHRLKMLKWRKKNPDKQKDVTKRFREKHKERISQERRDKYKNDPEVKRKARERELRYKASGRRSEVNKANPKVKERVKNYRLKNITKVKERQRRYREENKDFVKQAARSYREKNRESINRKAKERRQKNIKVIAVVYAKQLIAQRAKKHLGIKLKYSEMPSELLDVVTNAVKLKRELKKINNGKN